MNLLARVSRRLSEESVLHALIGATALAARGVGRSTRDVDLLVIDRRVLDAPFWNPVLTGATRLEIRAGDADDPLAGVVRFREGSESPVDVVVGRGRWQEEILGRAEDVDLGPARIPVVRSADLVLLKLAAGGAQDRWDVEQLLSGPDRPSIEAEVELRLPSVPGELVALWKTFRPA